MHLLCGLQTLLLRRWGGVGGSHVHAEFDTQVDAEALLLGKVCPCKCSAAGAGTFRFWNHMKAGTRNLLRDTEVDTEGGRQFEVLKQNERKKFQGRILIIESK